MNFARLSWYAVTVGSFALCITKAGAAEPVPHATPAPVPVGRPATNPPRHHYVRFVSIGLNLAPKVYNEFDPGDTGKTTQTIRGAAEFGLTLFGTRTRRFIEIEYQRFVYPHRGSGSFAPGPVTCPAPGCVSVIGGNGSAYVNPLELTESDITIRSGIIGIGHTYLATSFLTHGNDYGYPNLQSSFGIGLEHLPDPRRPFTFYAHGYYYPEVHGDVVTASGEGLELRYKVVTYEAGLVATIPRSHLFVELGYLGNHFIDKHNAPASATHSGPSVSEDTFKLTFAGVRIVPKVIGPFALMEVMVFLCAEASIMLNPHVTFASRYPTEIEIAAFCALRFALPWAQRRPRRVWAFIAIEVALLIFISAQVNGAAITIISVSVALRSAELLRPPTAFYATGVLLAVVLVSMSFWGRAQGISWNTIGDWAVITSLAWGLTGALTSFAAGERQANAELRKFAAIAADVAALKERGRIALELHDVVGHALTALNVQLESALRLREIDPVAADALIVSSKSLGSEALEDVRRTVARLRADPLERSPLDEVMSRLCERFEKTFAIDVRRTLVPVAGDPATNTAVIRILEEAFNNVARHAGGSTIDLRLARLAELTVLEMRDDGCGFNTNEHLAGHGLAIMRERASAAAIDLAIRSAPGSGTLVRMTWNPS